MYLHMFTIERYQETLCGLPFAPQEGNIFFIILISKYLTFNNSPLVVAVNEAPTIPAAVPPPPQLEPVPPPSPPQAPVPPPQVPATPPPSLRVPLTCIGNGLTPRKSRPPPPLDETAPLVAENVPPAVRHNRPSTGRVVGPYNLRRLR